jgi:hypothetical protein
MDGEISAWNYETIEAVLFWLQETNKMFFRTKCIYKIE